MFIWARSDCFAIGLQLGYGTARYHLQLRIPGVGLHAAVQAFVSYSSLEGLANG